MILPQPEIISGDSDILPESKEQLILNKPAQ